MKRLSAGLLAASALGLVVLGGCESKFVEPKPGKVSSNGLTLSERLNQKAHLDARLSQVEQSAEKIKRVLGLLKKVQDPTANDESYTPVDFMLDMNTELKNKIPENSSQGGLVRKGRIILPIKTLSPECQVVDLMLESSAPVVNSPDDESNEDLAPPAGPTPFNETITYSMRTCNTDGEFLPVLSVVWVATNLTFEMNNEALDILFGSPFNNVKRDLIDDIAQKSSCEVNYDRDQILESVRCHEFYVDINKSEWAHVKRLLFKRRGDIRFEAKADIYKEDMKKAEANLQVMADGKVEFNLEKVE